MHTATHRYFDQEQACQGFVAFEKDESPKPGVLIIHDWSGCNDFARQKACDMASLGYVGFAVDVYGGGQCGQDNDEKTALMTPLIEDRPALRRRLQAALAALKAMPEVDAGKIVAIGYCFGGLCVLDLARDGAELLGVVSLHGLLSKPDALVNQAIKARVLVLHGYDDPMVEPAQVKDFCDEMREACVDWQVHMYGNTLHAFTNPLASDVDFGTVYSPLADKRATQAMLNFFAELF